MIIDYGMNLAEDLETNDISLNTTKNFYSPSPVKYGTTTKNIRG